MPSADGSVGFLFVHVPKYSSYYRPTDDFMFINYIPMGVFALADLLDRNGVASRITHLGLETILDGSFSIVDRVRASGARIVGLSLHWHYQSFDVLDVASKLKRACPDVAIVLGGFTASRFPAEILENFPCVDAIIAGDAEAGVVPFARAVLAGERDFTSVPTACGGGTDRRQWCHVLRFHRRSGRARFRQLGVVGPSRAIPQPRGQ